MNRRTISRDFLEELEAKKEFSESAYTIMYSNLATSLGLNKYDDSELLHAFASGILKLHEKSFEMAYSANPENIFKEVLVHLMLRLSFLGKINRELLEIFLKFDVRMINPREVYGFADLVQIRDITIERALEYYKNTSSAAKRQDLSPEEVKANILANFDLLLIEG